MKRILLTALLAAGLLVPAGAADAAVGYPDLDGSGHSLVAEDFTAAGWDRGRTTTVDGAQLRLAACAKAHRSVRPVAASGHVAMRSVLGGPLWHDRLRDMAARLDAEAARSSNEWSAGAPC